MNFIVSFLTSFCVACIFIGSLYIICPEGNLSKPVKYLLSLLFVVIVISCGKLTFKEINFTLPDTETQSINTEELEISSAKYVFSYTLRANDINFNEITVCTDKLTDGSIVISKVIIYTDCEKEKVLDALDTLAKTREVEIING